MQAIDRTAAELLPALEDSRHRTLALVQNVADEDLARVLTPLLSPLYWDLGHIATFERRWLLGDGPDDLAPLYDPFSQPRTGRGRLPLLRGADCFEYMEEVRARVLAAGDHLDPFRVELVIQHEQQHNETMLQLLRLLDGYRPPDLQRPADHGGQQAGPTEAWAAIDAGRYAIGTTPEREGQFCYDNERNAHAIDLVAFEIAVEPVSNGAYREWVEHGGYERREWWSAAGWQWRRSEGAEMPLGWQWRDGELCERAVGGPRPFDTGRPVEHVSWFEAEAFARAHGARLPTEQEWEVAATADPATGARHLMPWGEAGWEPERANLDQARFGTVKNGLCHGSSPSGCHDMIGQVWEWTGSAFNAYPGFEPFCYAEYSAPFFGGPHRVLRGGSWATRARAVTARFRNWDFPQRRQLFAGFRLARDLR